MAEREDIKSRLQAHIYDSFGYTDPEKNELNAIEVMYNRFVKAEFETQYTCSFDSVTDLNSDLYDAMVDLYFKDGNQYDKLSEDDLSAVIEYTAAYVLDGYYRKEQDKPGIIDLSPSEYSEKPFIENESISNEDLSLEEEPVQNPEEKKPAAPEDNKKTEEKTISDKPKKKKEPKPKKPVLPEYLNNLPYHNIQNFLRELGCEAAIKYDHGYVQRDETVILFRNNDARLADDDYHKEYDNTIIFYPRTSSYRFDSMSATIGYVDEDLNVWAGKLTLNGDFERVRGYYRYVGGAYDQDHYRFGHVMNAGVKRWQNVKGWKNGIQFIQSSDEIGRLLAAKKPYVYDFCNEYNCDYISAIMFPQVEILSKAGFRFTENLFTYSEITSEMLTSMATFMNPEGTKPKDIFKMPKEMFNLLKNIITINDWKNYYNIYNSGHLPYEFIKEGLSTLRPGEMQEYANILLLHDYQDKPLFTWHSLKKYLERLDMYEAIGLQEASMLIRDYAMNCHMLEIKPNFNSDSLKREHDVSSRNYRLHQNEIQMRKINQRMAPVCQKMKEYEYKETVFFIRAIQDYNDLFDEAKQQSNCVGSYGNMIADGRSYVYVMREIRNPNKSLITVELDPMTHQIRQQYLAHNQRITSQAQLDFLDRWKRAIRDKRTGELDLDHLEVSKKELAAQKENHEENALDKARKRSNEERFAAFDRHLAAAGNQQQIKR